MSASPPEAVNGPEFWDRYMREQWEANGGREQTRLFAHHFLEHVRLPADARTLLDCSCAMGDALPEFHRRYPHLRLEGLDVSPTAIEVARARFGDLATFRVGAISDVTGDYDVIYCSNTLEHFEGYLPLAEALLARCRRLYVMVPYLERKDGRPLSAADGGQHVVTFDRRSFAPLRARGVARSVRARVLYAPGAWGPGPYAWTTRLRGWWTRDPKLVPARQVVFELERADRR